MVKTKTTYEGGLHCSMVHEPSGATLSRDAPVDNNGKGESFSPTDLVGAALAGCMSTIMGIVAERKGINLEGMTVEVAKHMNADPRRIGKLEVVNDQCGNPTNAVDLAHEILQLCVTHEYGLYHCTGEGICSWYDFASEIIRLSGVDASVAPCTSEEYKAKHPESADRPKWSALDNRMLRCTVGNDVRDWKDALACFFEHWDGDNGMKA